MNSLILSVAPFGGLASALPAMVIADVRSAGVQRPGPDEGRAFAVDEDLDGDPRGYEGGYLLL